MSTSDISPRAKVSYDQEKFTVEFSVPDYTPEELSIKTEGDILIVVAKQESKTKAGKSVVSKQFEQRFTLPSGVNPEKISSKLSKEGVLTVTAPRESLALTKSRKTEVVENNSKQNFPIKQSEGLTEPKIKYEKDKIEICIDAKEYNPENLDVKVEGSSIIITAKQQIQEAGGSRTRVSEQKFSLPSGVKAELVKSSLSRDGVLVITAPRGEEAPKQLHTETVENKMEKVLNPASWDEERRRESAFNDRRGISAFDDFRRDSAVDEKRIESVFDDLRRDSAFNTQIANSKQGSILDTSRSSLFEDGSLFGRTSAQDDISQVLVENDTYKIVVNVQNYKPEELVIKTVNNTVKVDAKHEDKGPNGQTYSTQSFSQSFSLPAGVDPESVSSALSQQGVLTISAPMPKLLKPSDTGMAIPIQHM